MQENLNDPNADKELIDYVKRIGSARTTYALNFLSDGFPIKPIEIASPMIQVQDTDGFNYYAASLDGGLRCDSAHPESKSIKP